MAVDEKEIRIGNWFKHLAVWSDRNEDHELDNKPFQWTFGDWYRCGESLLDVENIEPIPLSDDILLKCGFETNRIYWFKNKTAKYWDLILHDMTNSDQIEKGFYAALMETKTKKTDEIFLERPIKYLHQLQNLFFILCGKELNISL